MANIQEGHAHWMTRALAGLNTTTAIAGEVAVGVFGSRDGAGLVRGRSRARPVESDESLPTRVDVVIIGGGNVGCMAALTLAERSVSVALCEKGVIAGEASGRSFGMVDGLFLDPVKAPIVGRSKELWADLNTRIGADSGYRKTGVAATFQTPGFAGFAEAWLQSVQGAPGIDARMLSAHEAAQLAVGSGDNCIGGIVQPSDGQAEPQLFAPSVAEAIRRVGGVVLQNCAVRGIEASNGAVSAVVTERGPIKCGAVVLAGGAWSGIFARSLGIDIPQILAFSGINRMAAPSSPAPQMITISEQRGIAMRRTISGAYDTCIAEGIAPITADLIGNLPRLWPAIKSFGAQVKPALNLATFIQQWKIPHRWSLDQTSPFEATRILEPEIRMSLSKRCVDNTRSAFPQLAHSEVTERWSGAMVSTIDNMPVISAADSIPGLYIGAGLYYGLTMAPAAGEALADLVMGRHPSFDLSLYRLSRFSDGSKIVFRE